MKSETLRCSSMMKLNLQLFGGRGASSGKQSSGSGSVTMKKINGKDYHVINGELPKGWSRIEGELTAPRGYTWVSNNKSRFSGERKSAIIKIDKLSGWKLPKNAMNESDYLASKGLKDASSGWALDKLRGNRHVATARGRQRFNKEAENAEKEYQAKRNKAKAEYKKLVESGKLRPKTTVERMLEKAHGHPDNQSTQAARRMALKRGYDWKTGNKLK